MTPEQVPEQLVDVFRAGADTAELLSRQETREALAAVLGLWEETRIPGAEVSGCQWITIGKEHSTHDQVLGPLALAFAPYLKPERYTLALQRCTCCFSLRVQSLPGHWSDIQLGIPPAGETPPVPPPRSA